MHGPAHSTSDTDLVISMTSTDTDIDQVTLGEFVRAQQPTFRPTLLTRKPPKSAHESFMDMTVAEFIRDHHPDYFRKTEGGGELVRVLKGAFLKGFGKVW